MKLKSILTVSICAIFFIFSSLATNKEAFFKEPVTDLTSSPLSKAGTLSNFVKTYSPEPNGCIRTMQGLFNEQVIVKEENETTGDVCVELSHVFYTTDYFFVKIKQSTYWAKSSDIVYVKNLNQEQLDVLPKPISHKNSLSVLCDDVVTISEPWFDSATNKTYSAGTRFVCSSDKISKVFIPVKLLQFEGKSVKIVSSCIPANICVFAKDYKTKELKRAAFVNLLKKWSTNKEGVIPYVWGGASYIDRVDQYKFEKKVDLLNKQNSVGYWMRPELKHAPAGFDCSMLAVRAAQICSIPYFSRTTSTIPSTLVPLGENEELEPGDFLVHSLGYSVFAGEDSFIAAEGYTAGYGAVCNTPISKRFCGVKTANDIVKLYQAQKPLMFISKNGEKKERVFKIYKLPV